ncbi:MAG: HlyD family secretion protein [Novosphingobium sp.]|nr:HlyD family secretion protein [Novosphingobium sp.]
MAFMQAHGSAGVRMSGWIMAGGGLLAALAGSGWWLVDQAAFVTTTDARVRARMVTVSAEVAGRIAEMPVEAGDRIAPGQMLVRLDDTKAKLALAAATLDLKAMEAEVARARLSADVTRERGGQRVAAREAAAAGAMADVAAARALLTRAEADHARTLALHGTGVVAQAAMDRATASLEVARQAAARAEAEEADRRAGVGEAAAETKEADVALREAEAMAVSAHALRQRVGLLKVELKQHRVESPLAGVVDEVFAEPGEHVAAGARLALAHGDGVWIEANIKEPELPRVRVGAEVEIHLDASRVACRGVVERIGDAAASEFAVVPNANPAGVFTKITQRVPVRVKLGADCGRARPGAMATLRIRAS